MQSGSKVTIKQILACTLMLFEVSGGRIGCAETNPPAIPRWAAVAHALSLRAPVGVTANMPPTGVFPAQIGQYLRSRDTAGVVATYNSVAPTVTHANAFFLSLGSNGRACVTCHEPRSGWGVSAASIRQRFYTSQGTDPIFRVLDGATCDTDDVSSFAARKAAYRLLLAKGLIRVFLPLPDTEAGTSPPQPPDFEITSVSDPYGCTNLSSDPPVLSFYRRPLPAANLRFLLECPANDPSCAPLSIMWDGREPNLTSQATDATLVHAQSPDPPSSIQLSEIVNFESNIYDAQESIFGAGRLDRAGAQGGPLFLSMQNFSIGINDSLGSDFDNVVFTLFDQWQAPATTNGPEARATTIRASIARGESLFNTRTFTISKVGGLNSLPTDPVGPTPIVGTCSTCHDSPNIGNHSVKLALDIGVAAASAPVLDTSGLPVFTVECTPSAGPLSGRILRVTDLGRAMISGRCADVGKVKGPILRGLAARAPYFHNGSAPTLNDVVEFYDQRFSIGLTKAEKADLVEFLKSL